MGRAGRSALPPWQHCPRALLLLGGWEQVGVATHSHLEVHPIPGHLLVRPREVATVALAAWGRQVVRVLLVGPVAVHPEAAALWVSRVQQGLEEVMERLARVPSGPLVALAAARALEQQQRVQVAHQVQGLARHQARQPGPLVAP